MTDATRTLTGTALPPLILSPRRSRSVDAIGLPRLARSACVLAALALPALGIAAADTVHRAGGPGTAQAAAPVDPTDGAAAPATVAHQVRR